FNYFVPLWSSRIHLGIQINFSQKSMSCPLIKSSIGYIIIFPAKQRDIFFNRAYHKIKHLLSGVLLRENALRNIKVFYNGYIAIQIQEYIVVGSPYNPQLGQCFLPA